ncbi:MAG: AgmX/PglI C-terminal domain-containing protein [Polyangiaceae bacterium]
MSRRTPTLEVLVHGPTGFVGSFVFTSPKISIGRHPEAMVRLNDPAISSRHAELSLEGGLFRLRDLGSRTGTRINGVAVLPRQPIEAGDQIAIGPFRLRATLCEEDIIEAPAVEGRAAPSVPPTTSRPPPVTALSHPRTDAMARWDVSADDAPTRVEPSPTFATVAAAAPQPRPNLIAPAPPVLVAKSPPAVAPAPGVSSPVGARTAPKPPVVHVENSAVAPPWAFGTFDDARLEDDPDEENEDTFSPPFDLLQALSKGGLCEVPTTDRQRITLEVIRYRADRVLSIRHPKSKGQLRLGTPAVAAGAFEAGGFCLRPESCPISEVREGGRTLATSEVSRRVDGSKLRVSPLMQVTVDLPGKEKALVHWVLPAPALPPLRWSLRPTTEHARHGAISLAVHVAALVVLGLLALGDRKGQLDINAGRFATLDTKELELEPPAPPPPAAFAPNAPVVPTKQDPTLRTKSQPAIKSPTSSTQETSASSSSMPTPSTQKILSALGGPASPLSAISVSNLDALSVSAGGGFKVSGALGKAPGDTLRVVTTAGSDPDTKSASELGGNELGKVQARVGAGVVRARVTAVPQGIRGEGTLDRGEIQKVVNAHLYQIQGCYERQLAKDPSLSGKVFLDWVIGTSGGVSSVRIGRSTIRSVETVTCIQSAIQTWKFPQPQGGSVTVTYPFAFSSFGG